MWKLFLLHVLLSSLLLASGCDRFDPLPPPGPRQPLVVGLPANPVFQQNAPDDEGMKGFSHDLVAEFAKEIGIEVRFVTHANRAALTDELRKGRLHLLAADDELHFDIAFNDGLDLSIAMVLPDKPVHVWIVSTERADLREQAARFIEKARQDGRLRRLHDRYFGHIKRLDARNIQNFLEHIRTRLPDFRHTFQEAQAITGIDWRLLAALGYQESQWDPLATSPTGVRGLMMLTGETADRLGVKNRLDATESIRAGAKYLAMLMEELPKEIQPPDRLWFALAAYNLGMGHLRGGRHFAPGLGRDPNLWVDMKKVLPLLSRPEYYQRLKSGRARGGEAVIMVESVRGYYDILSRLEPTYTPPSLGTTEKPWPEKKHRALARG